MAASQIGELMPERNLNNNSENSLSAQKPGDAVRERDLLKTYKRQPNEVSGKDQFKDVTGRRMNFAQQVTVLAAGSEDLDRQFAFAS